jgi:hypothetical protein
MTDMPGWRNGRRNRLKIYRWQHHESSSLSPGTNKKFPNGEFFVPRERLESRRQACRGGVARFFSRKILVTKSKFIYGKVPGDVVAKSLADFSAEKYVTEFHPHHRELN